MWNKIVSMSNNLKIFKNYLKFVMQIKMFWEHFIGNFNLD